MNYLAILVNDVVLRPIVEKTLSRSFTCRALFPALSLEKRQSWMLKHPDLDQRATWENLQAEKVESDRRLQDMGVEKRWDPQASLEQWCYVLRSVNFAMDAPSCLSFLSSISEIRQSQDEIKALVDEEMQTARKGLTRKNARIRVMERLQADVDRQRSDWAEFGKGALARVLDEYQSGTSTEEPEDFDSVVIEKGMSIIENLTANNYARNINKRMIVREALGLTSG